MSRCLGLNLSALLLAVVMGTYLSGSAFADQTHVAVTIPAGGKSALIGVPIVDHPVMMSCAQTVAGNVGEGQATIIRSTTDGLLDWSGFDYFTNAVSHGFTSLNGTHMIYCDFSGVVDIEVGSATQIQIGNRGSTPQSVVIMFVF